jgi:hypothetical protein
MDCVHGFFIINAINIIQYLFPVKSAVVKWPAGPVLAI